MRLKEVVTYLLESYAIDDVIAGTGQDIRLQTQQQQTKFSIYFTELLWLKPLHFDHVYDKYVWKGIFMEGLHVLIHHNVRLNKCKTQNENLPELSRHVISLANVKHVSSLPGSLHLRENSSLRQNKKGWRDYEVSSGTTSTPALPPCPHQSFAEVMIISGSPILSYLQLPCQCCRPRIPTVDIASYCCNFLKRERLMLYVQ